MATKEWHDYRRRKYPARRKTNVDNSIYNILKKCYKEYTKNSCIPGMRQMNDPDITLRERIPWILTFVFMTGFVIYFFLYIWFGSISNPLVVSMETTTYPISEIDFPAIAICNINRISKKAMMAFERNIYKKTPQKNITNMKTWQLGRLIDLSYHEIVENFLLEHVIQNGPTFANKMIETMKELAPSCEEMLLSCYWEGKSVECKTIFDVRRTVRGHCCVFNYVLNYTSAGMPQKMKTKVKRQSKPDRFYGLTFVIDPMIEDYAYTTRPVQGLEILIFDPTHYADLTGGRIIQHIVEPNKAIFLELNSIKQHASREVRYCNLQTRRCLFHDEQKEKFNNLYSYSACIVDCRIRTVQSLCRCTPYFLPFQSDVRTCTLYDLQCLNKFKERLYFLYPMNAENVEGLQTEVLNSLHCPDCFPDCEFTKHITRTTKIPTSQTKHGYKDLKSYVLGNINMTDKCFVSIYQTTFYGTLARLEVVSYWFELVSNFGGVGGILIGLSFVSILEFIYFFIIKFIILVIILFFN